MTALIVTFVLFLFYILNGRSPLVSLVKYFWKLKSYQHTSEHSQCIKRNMLHKQMCAPHDFICFLNDLFLHALSVGAGIETGRGDAAVSALTESVAPVVVTGGGHAAQSANLTATAAAARTGRRTEIRRETGTESGHRKTKVRIRKVFFCTACKNDRLGFCLCVHMFNS